MALSATALFFFCSPARGIDATGEWSLRSWAGYDSEVFVDLERDGITESVGATCAGAENLLRYRFSGLTGSTSRLVLTVAQSATGYGRHGPARDSYLRAGSNYYRGLSDRTYLDASLSTMRFRRVSGRASDVDRTSARARLVRQFRTAWWVDVGAEHAWLSFPGCTVTGGGTSTASDRRVDLMAAVRREILTTGYLRGEVGYRRTSSNDVLFGHRGPMARVYWGSGRWKNTELSADVAYRQRSYPEYPDGKGGHRSDETWSIGLALDQTVSSRAVVFLRTSFTRQFSNVSRVGYDRQHVTAGFQVFLWRHAVGQGSARNVPPNGIAGPDVSERLIPETLRDGICFRCRAPGATSVSVVGGFNGWDSRRGSMQDADKDGVWEAVVTVDPGEWRYAFVVDGKWVCPEGAERYEEDGFGGVNGILEILRARHPSGDDTGCVTPSAKRRPTERIEG